MKKEASRHNGRSEGQAQTSISLDEKVLRASKEMAKAERRSFSKTVELLLVEALKDYQAARKEQSEATQSPSDRPGGEPDSDESAS